MSTVLTHNLGSHFPHLARHNSTRKLETSPLYRELKPAIEKVLTHHEYETYAEPAASKEHYRAVAWNIERGAHLEKIIEILQNHPELKEADLYLITEADLGMARSHNRNVARELAQALKLNYFFAPSYLNLSKGSGHEAESQGENTLGIHGNAILSRYPLTNFRTVVLPNGKDKMRGNEKRIGNQRTLIADLQLGSEVVTTACIHLDAHSSQGMRAEQMRHVLMALEDTDRKTPLLIGGDWNTSTYNSRRATYAIMGFWIRVFMGVNRVIRNHYLHPYSYWEKKLFSMLEERGLDYKKWNEAGVGTLIYDSRDIKQYKNLGDWIPRWCFRFIEWSLREHNGLCPLKLDWFAARNLIPSNPKVVNKLVVDGTKVSDHEAIVTEFALGL